MDEETLNKGKQLDKYIKGGEGLLKSSEDQYEECFITVVNNKGCNKEYYGVIPRYIWNKMLNVLQEETLKLKEEFNKL